MKEHLLDEAKKSIIDCNKVRAQEITNQALSEGMGPMEILEMGFIPGIKKVGDLFGTGKMFLPELMLAAETMKSVTEIINKAFPEQKKKNPGKVVIGTVEGDIHDIGKAIVVSLLKANGFEVYDLGRDVPTQKFIEKAQEVGADVIGSSCLLTTTMEGQKKLEQELKKAGLRGEFKTIVGGAPITRRWADRIGADAYAEDAADAVEKIRELVGR